MSLFNALMFGIATVSAQIVVRRYYGPLVRRSSRHRQLLWAWFFLYAFVGIQMGWVLRPFIGDPHIPVAFFRADAWGNAYVVVARLIARSIGTDALVALLWLVAAAGVAALAFVLFRTLVPGRTRKD